MSQGLVLGVDCGTQSLRATLYRPDGTLVAQSSRAYPTTRPNLGWAEQDPDDWWEALVATVPECLRRGRVGGNAVVAIACDGTSYTGVFCTNDGTPLRPALLWMDHRAADEARRIEATGDPALESCGRRISSEWMLPKALWTAEHEPDTWQRADRFIEGVDWLTYRLTGKWVTSNSNAAGKRHWTPDGGWPIRFYESLGVPKLAEMGPDAVVYLGEPVGTVQPEAARALGLSTDCIVGHAGMDGWTASIGMNCFQDGIAALSLGTSVVAIAETQRPKLVDGAMGPYPDGIRRGYYTYEAGQTSGAAIIGWTVSLLGYRTFTEAYQDLAAQAAAIRPGCDGLVVFDAWAGNRTPYFDPDARGTICGLTLDHSPAHVYRAVLEGCAYGVRNVVETLERGGVTMRRFRACGSGVDNRLWLEIIASVTGIPIEVSDQKQAVCLGSAVCAAVAGGLHPDLETAAAAMAPGFEDVMPGTDRACYDTYFALYLDTYRNMRETMWSLARTTR